MDKQLADELADVVDTMKDRPAAKTEQRCVKEPIGCGKPISGFRDALSEKEHGLSGWCQDCQDAFYG